MLGNEIKWVLSEMLENNERVKLGLGILNNEAFIE